MMYYHVPAALDQRQLYKPGPGPRRPNGWFLVAHEILTACECRDRNIPLEWLDRVEVKRTDTYHCFGARFVARGAKVVFLDKMEV